MFERRDEVLLTKALLCFAFLAQDELSDTDSFRRTSAQFTFTNFGFYKVSQINIDILRVSPPLKKEEKRQNVFPLIIEMGMM